MAIKYKIILPFTLPTLNEYILACRTNIYAGAKMKNSVEDDIKYFLVKYKNLNLSKVYVNFYWYEKNKRRDLDNIAFAKKFILDALQTAKVITGDGWREITGFTDKFFVDKENPRVEIVLSNLEDE